MDGVVQRGELDESFADIMSGEGTQANSEIDVDSAVRLNASATENGFRTLRRGVFLFDTSSIPADAVVHDVTLGLYVAGKSQALGEIRLDVVESRPENDGRLQAGDYGGFGTESRGSLRYDEAVVDSYNEIAIDSAAVQPGGMTRLGTVSGWELDKEFTGVWSSWAASYIQVAYAENDGNAPKLCFGYFIPTPAPAESPPATPTPMPTETPTA